MSDDLRINDRVVYSTRFLRSIGIGPTAPEWRDKGYIFNIEDGWLAIVWFETTKQLRSVRISNLKKIDAPNRDEAPFECGDAWNGLGFRPLLR